MTCDGKRFAKHNASLAKKVTHLYRKASQRKRTHSLELLESKPATIHAPVYSNIFFDAIKQGDGDLVDLFLYVTHNKLAECGAEQSPYMLPVQYAVQEKRMEIAKTIINATTNIDATCPQGYSAIHSAVFFEQTEIFDMLVKNGAKLDYCDAEHGVSLYNAAHQHKDDTFITLLVRAGATVPSRDDLWNDSQRTMLINVLRRQEWDLLIDTTLLLQPLQLPVLVVYEIYKRLPQTPTCAAKINMHKAWAVIRKVRETVVHN